MADIKIRKKRSTAWIWMLVIIILVAGAMLAWNVKGETAQGSTLMMNSSYTLSADSLTQPDTGKIMTDTTGMGYDSTGTHGGMDTSGTMDTTKIRKP